MSALFGFRRHLDGIWRDLCKTANSLLTFQPGAGPQLIRLRVEIVLPKVRRFVFVSEFALRRFDEVAPNLTE